MPGTNSSLSAVQVARIRAAYMTAWIKNTNPADVAAGPSGYMTPPYIEEFGARLTAVDMTQLQTALEALAAVSGG